MSSIKRMASRQVDALGKNTGMIESMLRKLGVILVIKYECADCYERFSSFPECQEHRKLCSAVMNNVQ